MSSFDELYKSIVRLYSITPTTPDLVGGGFFIHTSYVLTCAHVVNRALGWDDSRPVTLQEEVILSCADSNQKHRAQVVYWQRASLDIAILKLCDPVDNRYTPLYSINNLSNHRFKVAGFPRRYDHGVIAYGRISGTRPDGLVQLEVDRDAPYSIEPGFSGMPVWSENAKAVVGMIVSADREPAKKVGFMVPMSWLMSIPGFRELIAGDESLLRLQSASSAHPGTFLAYFTTNATTEAEYLSTFFVRPGIFSTLINQPASRIVYGADGYGKTAVCLMLKENLQTKGDCLVIHFDHFKDFPKNEVTLDTWSDRIQYKFLKMLLQAVRTSVSRKNNFLHPTCAESRANFWAACRISGIRQDIIELPPDHNNVLRNYRSFDSISRFDILRQIANDCGFQRIDVLIDGLNNNIEGAIDRLTLIRPLLAHLDPLHQRRFTFKFFLPQSMKKDVNVPGGLMTYELTWKSEQLREMLKNRLQNRPNPTRPNTCLPTVECFADLCVPDLGFDVDERLVQAANGSPRRLMHLVCTILEHHCQHDGSADRISAATIAAVLEAMGNDD